VRLRLEPVGLADATAGDVLGLGARALVAGALVAGALVAGGVAVVIPAEHAATDRLTAEQARISAAQRHLFIDFIDFLDFLDFLGVLRLAASPGLTSA
jgi:hypothetical protein